MQDRFILPLTQKGYTTKTHPMNIKNVCCIGAGYVGGPTMAVIAQKWTNAILIKPYDKDCQLSHYFRPFVVALPDEASNYS